MKDAISVRQINELSGLEYLFDLAWLPVSENQNMVVES